MAHIKEETKKLLESDDKLQIMYSDVSITRKKIAIRKKEILSKDEKYKELSRELNKFLCRIAQYKKRIGK